MSPATFGEQAEPIRTRSFDHAGRISDVSGCLLRQSSRTVMGADDAPNTRLCSAGTLGSIYSFLYRGGGSIGECFVFGRIAGGNVAAKVPWKQTQASLFAAE